MKNVKQIFLILCVLLALLTGYMAYYFYKNAIKLKEEQRIEKIKNDKLIKLQPGEYTKLVADTLDKKELRKKIKELGIDLENALLAQKIVLAPRDTIKIIEDIKVTDTTLTFMDFYPKKEDFFVKHITSLNTKDTTATGEFNFNPITISLAIGEQEDGTYKVITKVPEYFNINSIDVQSLPMENEKKDRFGILVGTDYVKGLNGSTDNIDFNSYIRINKFYIGGGYRTDNTIKGGIKIEF